MYSLTLTAEEREAMDWIGGRYFHGFDLAQLLTGCMAEWDEWDMEGEITFLIPESVAWEINDGISEEEYELACLSPDFAEKLLTLCFRIV